MLVRWTWWSRIRHHQVDWIHLAGVVSVLSTELHATPWDLKVIPITSACGHDPKKSISVPGGYCFIEA